MLVGIAGVFHPVLGFGKRFEVFGMSFSCPIDKTCAVKPVLSLADTLAAFSSFQAFAHTLELLSGLREKSPLQQHNYSR